MAATWGATVRPTPEADTRTQYVQVREPPCASGTCPTREAGTRSPYVPYGGAGAHASAWPSTISKLPPLDMACSISCFSDSPKLSPVLLRRRPTACGCGLGLEMRLRISEDETWRYRRDTGEI